MSLKRSADSINEAQDESENKALWAFNSGGDQGNLNSSRSSGATGEERDEASSPVKKAMKSENSPLYEAAQPWVVRVVDGDNSSSSAPAATSTSTNSTTAITTTAGTDSSAVELGNKRRVTVSAFKNMTLVNVREYYDDKTTNEEKPGKKGLSLTLDQYNLLKTHINGINVVISRFEEPEKPASGKVESSFPLGSKRKVTVDKFKGMILVNLREYYTCKITGDEKPGDKGIALKVDEYRALASQVRTLF